MCFMFKFLQTGEQKMENKISGKCEGLKSYLIAMCTEMLS